MARRWEVDDAAVRVAKTRLGIRHPVEVKVTSQRSTAGRYKGLVIEEGRRVHKITISTHICPSEAGKTLWHEMKHAQQREQARTQDAFFRALDDEMEREASAVERWNERIPLCRPR